MEWPTLVRKPETCEGNAHGIRASCRGGGSVYALGHDGVAWFCSCPALGLCAHLIALQLVTAREKLAA